MYFVRRKYKSRVIVFYGTWHLRYLALGVVYRLARQVPVYTVPRVLFPTEKIAVNGAAPGQDCDFGEG